MTTQNTYFRKLTTGMLILLILLISGTLKAQTKHNITVDNTGFHPHELTVMTGDTVVWTNVNGYHNVNGTQAEYPDNPESFGFIDPDEDWIYTFVFNIPGHYDFHCDPHAGLGMLGSITVLGESTISVAFTGMEPHNGQDVWLAVIDMESNEEIGRVKTVATPSFTVDVPGVHTGNSYRIDFYADFNENGYYDAPPVDHAWRLEVENITGDTTLDFAHNTTFTDIEWRHKLVIQFLAMNPHNGQDLHLWVYDQATGDEFDMLSIIVSPEFDMEIWDIAPGVSYTIDFYADFNENGEYDAPPVDHAWRINLENIVGDTTIVFIHDTNFTDIFPESPSPSPSNINASKEWQSGIRLYPNPASSYLNLLFQESEGRINADLTIFTIAGRVVHKNQLLQESGGIHKIEIDNLKPGIYFLEIKTNDHSHIIKFIKQ